MTKKAVLEPDNEDGMPRAVVGAWAYDKHERLRRYIDISRAARKKFHRSGYTYIELYCGTGRARVRWTNNVIDGSAILAYKTAKSGGAPFSRLFVASYAQIWCMR